ncbi:MAG TPA: hypothetical protein VIM62_11140 [Acidobacteriaceae bacterium]
MKLSLSLLTAAAFALSLSMAAPSAACNGNGNCSNAPGHGGSIHGAPGPLAGAGLPILAIGYGVYWLTKRRRAR